MLHIKARKNVSTIHFTNAIRHPIECGGMWIRGLDVSNLKKRELAISSDSNTMWERLISIPLNLACFQLLLMCQFLSYFAHSPQCAIVWTASQFGCLANSLSIKHNLCVLQCNKKQNESCSQVLNLLYILSLVGLVSNKKV